MASSAPAGSPAPLAGQPPPPPPLPIAQPPAVASAPATTFSPPPPPLALPPSPPLPPPAPPPSSTPVSPPPPPSATVAPSPPPLPQPVSPPVKPNSTVTPPTPPSTAAPPPASAPPPETPAASLPPPGIPTTPASPRTPPPTPSLPPAPPSRSKSKSLPQTPPPSPEKPNAPPPSAPLPATPSPPEEARPRPTETPTPPSPADSPQYPATPSPPVPPANQSSGFPPSSSASPEPPPLTPPVTPRPTPPGNSTATPPLPRQLANGSLPVAIGGQAGQRTETASHAPAGLIAGVAMGGVALIVMLGVVLFVCFKCKRKQGPAAGKASYGSFSSGVKEGASAAPPHDFQYLNQNVQPQSRAHGIVVPPRAFAPPILLSGNVDSTNSVPELHPPLVASLSFSRGNFTYGELVEATNSFSKANLLGEGGFGYVHKGVLPNGKEIAVKQLKIGSHQGQREFQAELDIISRVHHKHLVTLLGYCITGAERFLVYEFVPNNTLEYHLHGKGRPVLDWRTRLKIAIGTAKGLAYLQEDCSPTIIHRDIKAANILLDFNFEAKVSDFGLAKFFSGSSANASHISTRVVGTFGYLAPEYASSGKLTEKSDVYSFGVMLLELITGSPPIMRTESSTNEGQGLVDWARPLLNQASETGKTDKIVDPRLRKNYDSDEMLSMIGCAAACVRHSAWLRPRMSQIVRALEGEGSLADLDEGIKPGQSKVYRSSEMRKFSMILGSREDGISRQSDNTSEYGLYPSCSSSETHSR